VIAPSRPSSFATPQRQETACHRRSVSAKMPVMLRGPRELLCAIILLSACSDDGGAGNSSTASTTMATATSTETTTGTTAAPTSSSGSSETTGNTTSTTAEPTSTTAGAEDLDMQPEDFVCILDWQKVRRFRITNLLGHMDDALAVADSPTGGVYPVGTVIQLVPTEAMVKRAPGFAPDNADWEFFSLEVSAQGTSIMARGAEDVVNAFGGNCFGCHAKAAPQWDRICETDHGCDPLPFTAEQIEMVQMSDPRCP